MAKHKICWHWGLKLPWQPPKAYLTNIACYALHLLCLGYSRWHTVEGQFEILCHGSRVGARDITPFFCHWHVYWVAKKPPGFIGKEKGTDMFPPKVANRQLLFHCASPLRTTATSVAFPAARPTAGRCRVLGEGAWEVASTWGSTQGLCFLHPPVVTLLTETAHYILCWAHLDMEGRRMWKWKLTLIKWMIEFGFIS